MLYSPPRQLLYVDLVAGLYVTIPCVINLEEIEESLHIVLEQDQEPLVLFQLYSNW